MTSPLLKKTIFISILGHITVFSIFGFSFGNRIPNAGYTSVYFWGQFLRNSQVSQPVITSIGLRKLALASRYYLNPVRNTDSTKMQSKISNGIKPQFTLAFNSEKGIFIEKSKMQRTFPPKRAEEPTIIFHPLLPYGFTLYFKDRQVAHVELIFKIVSEAQRNSILIKRKISSGNLEVDLMTMRYIGHYLFIQQTNFTPDNWQTVKIDLSAKND